MTNETQYDLYSDASKRNPYPIYAAMREQAPVLRHAGFMENEQFWFVTGYAEAETVLRDHKPKCRLCPAWPNCLTNTC
jgi:cytochrome P450